MIRCNQITKIFSTRNGCANASSARGPCNFGPLTDLAISVLSEMRKKHCACPNPHFSKVLKMVHEKNLRVSLCVQELCHPRGFSLNSCSHSGMSEHNGSPLSKSWSSFLFGFGCLVGLVKGSPRSFRSSCSLDTDTVQESIPHRSSLSRVSLSLNTVVVCEVDELEEDVG